MKYPSILRRADGFTLGEALITLAIFLILGVATTPFTVNFYQRYQLINERNLFVSLVREARTMSLAGNGATDHGVHIDTTQFTIFEGTSYEGRNQAKDQIFPRETKVLVAGPADSIFKNMIGFISPAVPITYTMSNGAKQEVITINYAGSIDW